MNGPVELTRVGLDQISETLLQDLKPLYAQAFRDSRMHQRLVEDMADAPEIFQLFVARVGHGRREVLGARVIESKIHSEFDYRGHPPVHGKRFCVSPTARGQGVGKSLIEAGKNYCFGEMRLEALFGESNEIGALALHGREGALYSLASIEECSRRNGPDENVAFFRKFIEDRAFKRYRLPAGGGIRFVYCNNAQTTASFMAAGYAPRSHLSRTP
ncbi:MAG TPA: GNAT family N-acetyltransferase [Solirubrobacteraceae bacterium]|nr:GNAT family N-acetyltransferase [Solirubrobacteraceae bacterium]